MADLSQNHTQSRPLFEDSPPKPNSNFHDVRADLEILSKINARVGKGSIENQVSNDSAHVHENGKPFIHTVQHTVSSQRLNANPTTPARVAGLRNPFGRMWDLLPTPKLPKVEDIPSQTPMRTPHLMDEHEIEALNGSRTLFNSSGSQSNTNGIFGQDFKGSPDESFLSDGTTNLMRDSGMSHDLEIPSPLGDNKSDYEAQALFSKCAAYEIIIKRLRTQVEGLSFNLNKALAANTTKDTTAGDVGQIDSAKFLDDGALSKQIVSLQTKLMQQADTSREKEQHLKQTIHHLELAQHDHKTLVEAMQSEHSSAIASKDREIAQLKSRLERIPDSLSDRASEQGCADDRLGTVIAEKDRIIADHEAEIRRLEHQVHEIEAMEHELEKEAENAIEEALEGQIYAETQLAEKSKLEKKLREELFNKDAEIQGLKLEAIDTTGKLQGDNKRLQREISKLAGINEDLKSRNRNFETEILSLKNELGKQREELDKWKQAREQAEAAEERDKAERDNKTEALEQSLQRLNADVQTFQNELNQALRSLETTKTKLEKRNAEFAALESAINKGDDATKAQIEALNSVIEERDRTVETLQAELHDLSLEFDSLERDMDEQDRKVLELEAEKKEAQEGVEKAGKEVKILESALDAMEGDNREMLERIEDLEAQLEGAMSKISVLEGEGEGEVAKDSKGPAETSSQVQAEVVENLIQERNQLLAKVEALETNMPATLDRERDSVPAELDDDGDGDCDEIKRPRVSLGQLEQANAELVLELERTEEELRSAIENRDGTMEELRRKEEEWNRWKAEQQERVNALLVRLDKTCSEDEPGATRVDSAAPSPSCSTSPTTPIPEPDGVSSKTGSHPPLKTGPVPSPPRNLTQQANPSASPTEAVSTEEGLKIGPVLAATATAETANSLASHIAALRHRHTLEIRGLDKQIALLRNLLAKEERLRFGLVFQKRYLLTQARGYDCRNQDQLRLIEEILGHPVSERADTERDLVDERCDGRGRETKPKSSDGTKPGGDSGRHEIEMSNQYARRIEFDLEITPDPEPVQPRGRAQPKRADSTQQQTSASPRQPRPCALAFRSVQNLRPSLRSVSFALIAIHRMRNMAAAWDQVRKTRELLSRKMAERRKRASLVGGGGGADGASRLGTNGITG